MASQQFLDILASRRSYYQLNADSSISDARIKDIIEHALLHVPSAFNSQSVRIVLLLKEEHAKLWDIVKEVLKGVVPESEYPVTEKKLNTFQAAYGTVLFFDHRPTIKDYQAKFTLYADKLPSWAHQTNAMHQFAIWTALEMEGFGANLQHYNSLIDAKVAEQWNVPDTWNLGGQLVFGGREGQPQRKSFLPVNERLRIYGD